jgi:hypothetical protein
VIHTLAGWRRTIAGAVMVAAAVIPPLATAAAQVHPVANLVVGDGVMVLKAGPDKHVYAGVAGADTRTVTLTFDAGAVDDFVADAQVLVARGTRPLAAHASDRPEIQESESTRALSVTRHIDRVKGQPVLSYHVFVSDDKVDGFTLVTTPVEIRSILLALHRAARAAYAASAPPPDTTHHTHRPAHAAPPAAQPPKPPATTQPGAG